jgi:hypothetical protein
MKRIAKLWTTKDGERIRICDMTDAHLLNAIRMCERAHKVAQLGMPYPMFQGEMASYYAEAEYYHFQASGPEASFPLYDDLCFEAQRRGIELPRTP